jgi:hypothetical protein
MRQMYYASDNKDNVSLFVEFCNVLGHYDIGHVILFYIAILTIDDATVAKIKPYFRGTCGPH